MRKYKNDIFLVVGILIVAVVSLVVMMNCNNKTKDLTAYIYHDEELVKTINLDHDEIFFIEGTISTMEFEVHSGKIKVKSSDCDDHICMNQGYISKTYQTITCLPNHIYVKLVGNSELDVIV